MATPPQTSAHTQKYPPAVKATQQKKNMGCGHMPIAMSGRMKEGVLCMAPLQFPTDEVQADLLERAWRPKWACNACINPRLPKVPGAGGEAKWKRQLELN